MFVEKLLLSVGTPTDNVEGSVSTLLIYITVALGTSFLCSMWEAVVLSTSVSYVEVMAEHGKRAAVIMRIHKENLEQAISAILTLNTIAHTVGAAGAGAQAAAIFGSEWIGIISAVLTFLILVFSEIIPKTLGAVYWKQLMPFTAYGVRLLILVLYPAVKAFHYLSKLMTPAEKEPTITRSELEMLAEISQGEGTLEAQEQQILQNLLRLGLVQVSDIMTPRTVAFMLQEDMTVGEVAHKYPALVHSRIPIYKENQDDVTGFVLRYQVLYEAAEDHDDKKLKEIVVPIHSVPESLNAFKALQEFITRGEHIFLVLDEYGGTAGIITMEDAIESLLGTEIVDETDLVEDMRLLAKQRYARQKRLYATMEMKKIDTKPNDSPAALS